MAAAPQPEFSSETLRCSHEVSGCSVRQRLLDEARIERAAGADKKTGVATDRMKFYVYACQDSHYTCLRETNIRHLITNVRYTNGYSKCANAHSTPVAGATDIGACSTNIGGCVTDIRDYVFCGHTRTEVLVAFLDFLNKFWPPTGDDYYHAKLRQTEEFFDLYCSYGARLVEVDPDATVLLSGISRVCKDHPNRRRLLKEIPISYLRGGKLEQVEHAFTRYKYINSTWRHRAALYGSREYLFGGHTREEALVAFLDYMNDSWPLSAGGDHYDDLGDAAKYFTFGDICDVGPDHDWLIEVRPNAERCFVPELNTPTKAARVFGENNS